jgi:Domain of unknown function (DUF4286)
MILYNITYGVDREIEEQWLSWMKEIHIPQVMDTGYFTEYKFYKVLSHDDEQSVSFCIQYFTPSIVEFNQYLERHATSLVEEHHKRFKDRHVAFNTLLEDVE